MADTPSEQHPHRLVVAVFPRHDAASSAVEALIERDFPPDSISILGKGESSGDDVLGIYYSGVGERMKAWATHGAVWGGLWGLLSSAAGMFVIPGLGAIFAVGPIVEAIAAAAAGAAVSGGVMAGAAAASQLGVALHRMGLPHDRIEHFHNAIGEGCYVVLLRCGNADEAARRHLQLSQWGAAEVDTFPYLP